MQSILDRHSIADGVVVYGQSTPEEHFLEMRVCTKHRDHREILRELAEVADVVSIETD